MDNPGDKESQTCSQEKSSDHSTYDRNILQPAWVRCAFRPCDEVDRFLLVYRRYFLLPISVFLWLIFFLT